VPGSRVSACRPLLMLRHSPRRWSRRSTSGASAVISVISAAVIAERYPFLLCRPVVGRLEIALALADILLLPGVTWLRKAQYDVVPLMLNLCASCAQAHRDEITKELCLENPLVGLLARFGGFTEMKWPTELG